MSRNAALLVGAFCGTLSEEREMRTSAIQLHFDGTEEKEPEKGSAAWREWEITKFVARSQAEGGLVSQAQTADILDVSTPRVAELIKQRQLSHWTYFGRVYLSLNEVHERRKSELSKGGRPRSFGARLKLAGKIFAKEDAAQWMATVIP